MTTTSDPKSRTWLTTHPFALRAIDDRGHGAIHLADGGQHSLIVETQNVGKQDITFSSKYVPLDLSNVATTTSARGIFTQDSTPDENLMFPDWKRKSVGEVPFDLIDPQDGLVKNVIVLKGGGKNDNAFKMPTSVTIPCRMKAKKIHLLSGVSGWGADKSGTALTIRLTYEDKTQWDKTFSYGTEFFDWTNQSSSLDSIAFKLANKCLRYLAVTPTLGKVLEKIEFFKDAAPTTTAAPLIMAVTVETDAATAVASATDWHYQIVLRRTVVDLDALTAALAATPVTTPDWSDTTHPATKPPLPWSILQVLDNVHVRLYALCTVPAPPPLKPSQTIQFKLPLQAPRGIGARGTHLHLSANPATVRLGAVGVSGKLTHHLQIIDVATGAGRPGLGVNGHFEAGFIGGNRILNDGTTKTDLTLRIQPTKDLEGNLMGLTKENWNGCVLTVSLPVLMDGKVPDGQGLGDLGTKGQVEAVKINGDPLKPNTLTWSHTFTDIVPTWPLDLTLSGIVSKALNGAAIIRVAIKNIPLGATTNADDEIYVTVEKSPLLFTGHDSTFYGAVTAKKTLAVEGDTTFAGAVRIGTEIKDPNGSVVPGQFVGHPMALSVKGYALFEGLRFSGEVTSETIWSRSAIEVTTAGTKQDITLAPTGGVIVSNAMLSLHTGKALLFNGPSDAHWGLYKAPSGGTNALDGGAAVAGGAATLTQDALRLRVGNGDGQAIIFENMDNKLLFSVAGKDGAAFFPGNVGIGVKKCLEFGAGETKQADAGKIGYQLWGADSLDIVGGGTELTNRKIRFFAEGGATFSGSITATEFTIGNHTLTEGMIRVLSLLATSNLTVAIKCYSNGYVLENYKGNRDDGHSDRTIQFKSTHILEQGELQQQRMLLVLV